MKKKKLNDFLLQTRKYDSDLKTFDQFKNKIIISIGSNTFMQKSKFFKDCFNDLVISLTSKLNKSQLSKFNKIKKYNPNISKYDLINNWIIKNKFIKSFDYIINKYSNFSKLINQNCYLEFIDHNDLFMLIKDTKCQPFWNDQVKELSYKIFMPTLDNLVQINSPQTFSSSNWFETVHYSGINKSDDIITTNTQAIILNETTKTNKIKLYLNHKQKIALNRLMGGYRYFYNRTINFINNYNKLTRSTYYEYKINSKTNSIKVDIDLKDMPNRFSMYTIRSIIKCNYPDWFKEISMPSHLIDKAIGEACDNYSKCMEKFRRTRLAFKLKPKIKKTKMQTMNIESGMVGKNGIFVTIKDLENNYILKNIKSSYKLSNIKNLKDSSITYNTRLNEWYLNATYSEKNNTTNLSTNKICSIDPGIKTFATIYDFSGVAKIGTNNTRNKIKKICRELDIIQSKMSKATYNSKRNLRQAYNRKHKYLENLKTELHNKTVRYLTLNYGKIIIPPFETQKLAEKLSSSENRTMMTLSFYKFLTRLKNKCIDQGKELMIRPEYYTSKTCGCCGWINKNLSNADEFNCSSCGLKIDRDMNGARNIMLRNLNESYLL
jgi:putative transposase